jgi:hypothetical protein
MAPQRFEKIEFAPGSGMVSEATNPQELVHGRTLIASHSGWLAARTTKLQKEAPSTLKSLDAELKTPFVFRHPGAIAN